MQYYKIDFKKVQTFCIEAFKGYGFNEEESKQITDVLLAADLSGIESHGVQRMIRYHKEITGGMVKIDAKPEVVFETPVSAVIDAHDSMGQLVGRKAMELAITGMVPHTTLGRQALKMLKVYADANHNHAAQSPVEWTGEIK